MMDPRRNDGNDESRSHVVCLKFTLSIVLDRLAELAGAVVLVLILSGTKLVSYQMYKSREAESFLSRLTGPNHLTHQFTYSLKLLNHPQWLISLKRVFTVSSLLDRINMLA
jgi:hypothetical protein